MYKGDYSFRMNSSEEIIYFLLFIYLNSSQMGCWHAVPWRYLFTWYVLVLCNTQLM